MSFINSIRIFRTSSYICNLSFMTCISNRNRICSICNAMITKCNRIIMSSRRISAYSRCIFCSCICTITYCNAIYATDIAILTNSNTTNSVLINFTRNNTSILKACNGNIKFFVA